MQFLERLRRLSRGRKLNSEAERDVEDGIKKGLQGIAQRVIDQENNTSILPDGPNDDKQWLTRYLRPS